MGLVGGATTAECFDEAASNRRPRRLVSALDAYCERSKDCFESAVHGLLNVVAAGLLI
jgi:hypothetical protein